MRRLLPTFSFIVTVAAVWAFGFASRAAAQSVNWDGQTGGIVTTFATVADSPARGLGRPLVSFLVLSGGDVIGTPRLARPSGSDQRSAASADVVVS